MIKFTATWCGPCKAIEPLFADFAQQAEIRRSGTPLKIIVLDVDDNFDVYADFKKRKLVPGIPGILLYQCGTRNPHAPDEICIGAGKNDIVRLFTKALNLA
jgi:thiol-disulfide isomerase/thioredoxin